MVTLVFFLLGPEFNLVKVCIKTNAKRGIGT